MKLGLAQQAADHKVVAIMGICKNAGKTTVLNYLIHNLHDSYALGITSIGYDGEEQDVVTLLDKPRIWVYKNMMIATCTQCLAKSEIDYEVLYDTQIQTVLGSVLIVRALSDGLIEVSGSNQVQQVKGLQEKMLALGAQKIMIDGAAGRLSFGILADGIILSVGAAYSQDIQKLVNHVKDLELRLNLQRAEFIKASPLQLFIQVNKEKKSKGLNYENHENLVNPLGLKNQVNKLSDQGKIYHKFEEDQIDTYYFTGAMADKDVQEILKSKRRSRIIVGDASKIFLSARLMKRLLQKGMGIQVENPMHLAAVTINPMNPYGPWLTSKELGEQLKAVTLLPIYDVVEECEYR